MAVTTALILASLQDSEPFYIEADSSDFASGAVLSQQLPREEKWHPVAFYSKSLSLVERNYKIYGKEMLAIIRVLEEWRHFLKEAQHPVERRLRNSTVARARPVGLCTWLALTSS